MTTSVRLYISTVDDVDVAMKIAHQLVEERLAACVNIIPNVISLYKWKGKIETAEEWLLLIKTQESRERALLQRFPQLHPYDVPELVGLDVAAGHAPYLGWVVQETGIT